MKSRNAEKRQSSLRDKKTKENRKRKEKIKTKWERHKSSQPESNQPKREEREDMPEKEPEPSVLPSSPLLPTCLVFFHFFFFLFFFSLPHIFHFRHHPNDPPYPHPSAERRTIIKLYIIRQRPYTHTHTRVAFAPSGLRSACSLVHITGSLTLPAGSLDYTHILLSPYFFFFSISYIYTPLEILRLDKKKSAIFPLYFSCALFAFLLLVFRCVCAGQLNPSWGGPKVFRCQSGNRWIKRDKES